MNQKIEINPNRFRRITGVTRFFALIGLYLFAANATFSQNSDPKLSALRKQFAVNYLQPASHFALARYYLDKNDWLQAFLIVEYARRYRFSEKEFDTAFKNFFGDNSPEPSDQAKQAFEEGYRLVKTGKLDEAERSLIEAAKLAPKSGFIQGWVGRFYFKVKPNSARALEYYFKAYFLDPHAYETEFVESRIRNISFSAADVRFAELIKSGKSLTEISTDANPLIVGNAVRRMADNWKKEYIKVFLECMSSDDSLLRWLAFTTLYKNADASFDEILSALLNDDDLRKRGLVAYALIARRKEKGFDILREMLANNAELIRFDAASTLVLEGGVAGLEILKSHRKVETSQALRELIDKTLPKK